MGPLEHSHSVPSRRGRRIAILLIVLLLIGLPLYLWPLRGGIQGLPGASALSGAPHDPRSAAAVAQLPADVWDGLMGRRDGRAGPKRPGNLTRISPHEEGGATGNGSLDGNAGGGAALPALGAGSTPMMTAMLGDGGADSAGTTPPEETGATSPFPGSAPSGDGGGGPGGNAGDRGYSPFPGNLGPFPGGGGPGGGNGFPPPTFTSNPDPNDPPMPTPEPSTLMLVGSNVALVGAFAWRHLRKRQERKPSG